MPDEQKPLQRARPAAPAMPPFRGHAPAPRVAPVPKAPGSARGAPPVVAVRPAKAQAEVTDAAEQAVATVLTDAGASATDAAQRQPDAQPLVLEPPGAEVMPPHVPLEARAAAQPLAGLPYFDDAGQPHGAVQSPTAPTAERAEPQLHAAATLERVAAAIRAGTLTVDGVDAFEGEPATLAAVLASLLRQQR